MNVAKKEVELRVDKLDLESFLLDFKDETILYCANPGNTGDTLIACATYQLFDKLGLRYEEISVETPVELTLGKVVIYGGGGNLVAQYEDAKNFIKKHHKTVSRLVILPHTILSYSELLSELGSNVVIICRELASYQYVSKYHGQAKFYLADDVALSLNVDLVFKQCKNRFNPLLLTKLTRVKVERAVWRFKYALKNFKHHKSLYAFRWDVEKTNFNIPYANIDISRVFSGDGMDRCQADEQVCNFLNFINKFNVIYTNRLHVAIGALLLGKQVYFYDNSYGKNRFVYESSLKERFENLRWEGDSLNLP